MGQMRISDGAITAIIKKVLSIRLPFSLMENYSVLVEKDEDGWFVSDVVNLPGCHTQGKTLAQLFQRTQDAIVAYKESIDFKE